MARLWVPDSRWHPLHATRNGVFNLEQTRQPPRKVCLIPACFGGFDEWKERLKRAISKTARCVTDRRRCDSPCAGAQRGGETVIGCGNCFPSSQSQMTALLIPAARWQLKMTVGKRNINAGAVSRRRIGRNPGMRRGDTSYSILWRSPRLRYCTTVLKRSDGGFRDSCYAKNVNFPTHTSKSRSWTCRRFPTCRTVNLLLGAQSHSSKNTVCH